VLSLDSVSSVGGGLFFVAWELERNELLFKADSFETMDILRLSRPLRLSLDGETSNTTASSAGVFVDASLLSLTRAGAT